MLAKDLTVADLKDKKVRWTTWDKQIKEGVVTKAYYVDDVKRLAIKGEGFFNISAHNVEVIS